MCRRKEFCTELNQNRDLWDKRSPLMPPNWFNSELELFINAVKFASNGNRIDAIKSLSQINSNALRNWYCEHGQMSGMYRNNLLNIETEKDNPQLDTLRSPDKYRNEVFQRDGFTCQYCGIRVIPKEVFAALSKFVGIKTFRDTGTNNERHGVVLAFRANADHVVPWNHGGKTHPDNLVTSCWSCNYGKSGYTLEEIGITDPRKNKLTNQNWGGLTEFLLELNQKSKY